MENKEAQSSGCWKDSILIRERKEHFFRNARVPRIRKIRVSFFCCQVYLLWEYICTICSWGGKACERWSSTSSGSMSTNHWIILYNAFYPICNALLVRIWFFLSKSSYNEASFRLCPKWLMYQSVSMHWIKGSTHRIPKRPYKSSWTGNDVANRTKSGEPTTRRSRRMNAIH